MSFRICHCVPYYSQSAHDQNPRSQQEWDAYKFCTAVKKKSVSGYFTLPKVGRISEKNIDRARTAFGALVGELLKTYKLTDCVLVPVPSKDSFVSSTFRSLVMVREAVPAYLLQVKPALVFNKSLSAASTGGDRGFYAVYPHLSLTKTFQHGSESRRIVLIDDIITTGGTMLASKRRLEEAGHRVELGIACGRTTHAKISTIFQPGFVDVSDDATSVPFLES